MIRQLRFEMRISARAIGVLGGRERARQWLQSPLKILGGKTPLQMLSTARGARKVEHVLGRLEHGVFF